jgi:hypothetical protein
MTKFVCARLLRLKWYEQPPPGYFENFLHEFRRWPRQRDELRREPVWGICVDRARDFVFRHNVRPLASYAAGIAAAVACAAVISITIYQQPDTTQFAVQSSPVPTRSPNTEKELDFAPRVLIPPFRDGAGCSRCKQQGYSDATGAPPFTLKIPCYALV